MLRIFLSLLFSFLFVSFGYLEQFHALPLPCLLARPSCLLYPSNQPHHNDHIAFNTVIIMILWIRYFFGLNQQIHSGRGRRVVRSPLPLTLWLHALFCVEAEMQMSRTGVAGFSLKKGTKELMQRSVRLSTPFPGLPFISFLATGMHDYTSPKRRGALHGTCVKSR